ncbi:hypothetical protein JZ751_006062 [Albula glossodonta]|uniref:G-protein coupled receptors family 1 profile domain-containing protein n=1 Tax=Albula glossodonta TaxID=121402 RepID=A0A8T2P3J5_9TELE|nr:hypothetical protein JZ751_006062 [Albula glossodonta]
MEKQGRGWESDMEGNQITSVGNVTFSSCNMLTVLYFKRFQYCGYAPHVRSCKPNTDGISSLEDLLANIVLRVFVWVVSATTCVGNIFVIGMRSYIRSENKLHAMAAVWSFQWTQAHHEVLQALPAPADGTRSHMTAAVTAPAPPVATLLVVLRADGLMGVYLFVIGAFDLKFRGEYNHHAQAWMDSAECQVVGSLAMLSTEVSVLLLTYLTLEKYVCIVYPFHYISPRRGRTVSVLISIWILGFAIAFIPLVGKDLFRNFYGTNGVCFPLHSEQPETRGAQIYSIIIFLEYSNHIKKEVTIAKRFFSIVITDSLCWIPIFILKILSLTQVEIPGTISSWVVIFILPINSALNPILYTLTTRPFKETILQVWNNYRQRRTLSGIQKHACAPSFTWQEMWPLQDTARAQSSPEFSAQPSEMSFMSGKSHLLPLKATVHPSQ